MRVGGDRGAAGGGLTKPPAYHISNSLLAVWGNLGGSGHDPLKAAVVLNRCQLTRPVVIKLLNRRRALTNPAADLALWDSGGQGRVPADNDVVAVWIDHANTL